MKVFISYDFEDEDDHQNLIDRLDDKKIPYWDPKKMLPGKSLRDQIREGINECPVCVFLATERSVKSRWCLAEIGAFWGLGRPVVIFTSGITQKDIPEQFAGDLTTPIFNQVVHAVETEIFEAKRRKKEEETIRPRLVSEMTVATLYDLLVSLKAQNVNHPVSDLFRLISDGMGENHADAEAVIQPLLEGLISVDKEAMQTHAVKYWPATFTLKTKTGTWLGFAGSSIAHPEYDGYSKCFLALCDEKRCLAVTVAAAILERDQGVECEGLIAKAGEYELEHIMQLLRTPGSSDGFGADEVKGVKA